MHVCHSSDLPTCQNALNPPLLPRPRNKSRLRALRSDIAYFMKRPHLVNKRLLEACGGKARGYRTLSKVIARRRKSNCGIAHPPFAANGINDLEGNYNDKSAKSVALAPSPRFCSQRHFCMIAFFSDVPMQPSQKTVIG